MGCGASSEHTATSCDAHDKQGPLPASALDVVLINDPLHQAAVEAPLSAEDAALYRSLDADWCARSAAGAAEAEPSPVAVIIRRGAAVAAARVLHGIDGDPEQFTAAVEASDSAQIAHHDAAIQAWMLACSRALGHPSSAALSRYDTFHENAHDNATVESVSPPPSPSGGTTPQTMTRSSVSQSPYISIDFSTTPGSSAAPTPGSAMTIGSTGYMPACLGGRDSRPVRLSCLNLLRHESATSVLRRPGTGHGLPELTDRTSLVLAV